jgi:hypothetical protein
MGVLCASGDLGCAKRLRIGLGQANPPPETVGIAKSSAKRAEKWTVEAEKPAARHRDAGPADAGDDC